MSDAKVKTCKYCKGPAVSNLTLCEKHRAYQTEYMRKRRQREKVIREALKEEGFPLDPFIYQDGYELQVRRISKTAGVKIELTRDNESHAIILPSAESRNLMSYMGQVLKGET